LFVRPTLRILAIVLVLGTIAGAQTVSLQLDAGAFKVIGWQAPAAAPAGGWPSVLNIYAGTADAPMLGRYTVEGSTLLFRPTYPLAPGVKYRAVFREPGRRDSVERVFDGPAQSAAPPTRVERVYPSADVLASNNLRLFIYFSAPMSRGEVAAHLHILDSAGKELKDVLLPGQELWDPNNQRLTMTFDPGRIKRGLESNTTIGPPIAEGARYSLVIDRAWRDARGLPLADAYRKDFRGGPAVRVPPDPKEWHLTSPRAGTSSPLVVDFGRSMNYTLLQRMLQVSGAAGRVVGTIAVDKNETVWRFTPASPWTPGAYRLLIDDGLEDVAGNRIGQPFDIDVFEHVSEHLAATRTITLPFTVAK
jgi:hypothetical protein